MNRLLAQPEHHPAKLPPCPGPEDLLPGSLNAIPASPVLQQVHQKIGLYQDAVIQALDMIIGVVVPYQPGRPADRILRESQTGKQRLCGGRAQLLLELSAAVSVPVLRQTDTDIMNIGGDLQGLQLFPPRAGV